MSRRFVLAIRATLPCQLNKCVYVRRTCTDISFDYKLPPIDSPFDAFICVVAKIGYSVIESVLKRLNGFPLPHDHDRGRRHFLFYNWLIFVCRFEINLTPCLYKVSPLAQSINRFANKEVNQLKGQRALISLALGVCRLHRGRSINKQ